MKISKLYVAVLALALSFTFVKCNSNNDEKNEKNETAETKQDEVNEDMKDKIPATTTTFLPDAEITLDKLPAGVKEFVLNNYAGYKMVKALSDPLCQGGDAIDLAVAKTGSPNLSLIFKPDGSFVQQEEDVPLSAATNMIRTTLKTKYAGYTAGSQIERLVLADKTVQYLADLTKGKVTKEVIFTEDGIVVCEK